MPAVAAAPSPTSENLLARVADGNRDAFARSRRRFMRPIYTEALRVVGDAAAAEDVTQEVFVRVWRAAGRFDADRGSAAAWICTIARNRARDHARMRRPVPVEDAAEQHRRGHRAEATSTARIAAPRRSTSTPRWPSSALPCAS